MRKNFLSYYRPTEPEFDDLWKNCIFVLDANVLLNLYRYSSKTREEFFSILKSISKRLWVPHQAAFEYHNNRLEVIGQQASSYAKISHILEETKKQIESKLGEFSRHPLIDVKKVIEKINSTIASIEEDLNKKRDSHPDLLSDDPILDLLTKMLDRKVGSGFSQEKQEEIYKKGETRYSQSIPPGFNDSKKSGVNRFGDLIIWYQIIDMAKEVKKQVILITDDKKDDWWWKFNGKTIGPRQELISEIYGLANVAFYMYQTDPFMVQAQKHLKTQVDQEAINEVRSIRERDEENLQSRYLIDQNVTKREMYKKLLEMEWAKYTELQAMVIGSSLDRVGNPDVQPPGDQVDHGDQIAC